MITKLSHAELLVRDQNQAYDVYVNKLGFKVHTDITMDNGLRWLTISPPSQPDLQIVLSEPVEPMFAPDLIPHVRALLDKDAMRGGRRLPKDVRRPEGQGNRIPQAANKRVLWDRSAVQGWLRQLVLADGTSKRIMAKIHTFRV
jgi:catechol 2,3-dioxygenase-like lactoylglutathione lyase family enzyme